MYKPLLIGVVALYVILTGFCFLLMLAISGIYISNLLFYASMTGWLIFCFTSVYTRSPLFFWLRGRLRRPILEEERRLQSCLAEVQKNVVQRWDIKLRIHEEDTLEAYASGNNIIAVSRALLNYLTDEELKGVLAHELGHLKSRDCMMSSAFGSAALLPRLVGRIGRIVTAIFVRIAVLFLAIFFFTFLFKPAWAMPLIAMTLFILTFALLDRLFNWLRLALSRICEYRQDEYAHRLGFGAGLRDALIKLSRAGQQTVNIFHVLMHSSHPVIYHRIRRLEMLEGMRNSF